jgi:hypothetical protein
MAETTFDTAIESELQQRYHQAEIVRFIFRRYAELEASIRGRWPRSVAHLWPSRPPMKSRRSWFARDSPLEVQGFEPWSPVRRTALFEGPPAN